MARYTIDLLAKARKDLAAHHKAGDKVIINRIERIFEELEITPFTGIGKPEPLKYGLSGMWSRKLDNKNRIVYLVNEETMVVQITSAKGHYDDK